VVGSTLFLSAEDGVHGRELWKSDGTAAGTVLVKDIRPVGASSPWPLAALGGTLLFGAEDGTHGMELWRSDGTEAGTILVKDINPGTGSSYPGTGSLMAAMGGVLYFAADDGVHGFELWKSDGTAAGTVLVKDINPTGHASPTSLIALGNTLLFAANDGVHGVELWKSDGTEVGTVLVKDINPGTDYSNPHFAGVGATGGASLLFAADDGVHGVELWKSDGTDLGTALVKDVCAGSCPGLQ